MWFMRRVTTQLSASWKAHQLLQSRELGEQASSLSHRTSGVDDAPTDQDSSRMVAITMSRTLQARKGERDGTPTQARNVIIVLLTNMKLSLPLYN